MKDLNKFLVASSLTLLVACGDDKAETANASELLIEDSVAEVEYAEDTTQAALEFEGEKPAFFVGEADMVTAKVIAIDHATRDVTLEFETGETMMLNVSEQAQNLDQVTVGSTVVAEFMETVSIELVDGADLEAGAASVAETIRAAKGEKPGMGAIQETVEVAMVREINLEENTYVLEMPSGEMEEFVARNTENLRSAKVGDAVVMTLVEAMAISVEPASEEEAE